MHHKYKKNKSIHVRQHYLIKRWKLETIHMSKLCHETKIFVCPFGYMTAVRLLKKVYCVAAKENAEDIVVAIFSELRMLWRKKGV